MKFIILAFNPVYINTDDLQNLVDHIEDDEDCAVYTIAHVQREAEPIYCVQLVDTKEFK